MVIAPANTGSLVTKRIAVILTAHKNNGRESNLKEREERAEITVLKKLIEPRIDLTPAT